MSKIDFLIDRFRKNADTLAIAFRSNEITYNDLVNLVENTEQSLREIGIKSGDVVVLFGDYSPLSVATLLSLISLNCILVPLTPLSEAQVAPSLEAVAVKWWVDVTGDELKVESRTFNNRPELYAQITADKSPGLVLFTSGSSGAPKAVVHDFSKLLEKFHVERRAMITINFLLFDHWGGLNTLLHCLSNNCLVVMPDGRTPKDVCRLVEKYKIELLPTTPSFLSMLLISRAYEDFNLSTLKLITYGAEPMPEATLLRLRKTLPEIELRQTYGMIEVGVLRARSRSADSLWLKMGGKGYKLRVVDNILQIKAESAMLGYINAPSPFTEDGFLITGDRVEVDGEWLRILGRESDLINVGGQKVYPAEVEAVLFQCPEVFDAVVSGESNPILGKVVSAKIILKEGFDRSAARKSIMLFCRKELQDFMVPARLKFVDAIEQSHRLKRKR